MNGRERVRAALLFEPVDRIPIETEPGFEEYESDVLVPRADDGGGIA